MSWLLQTVLQWNWGACILSDHVFLWVYAQECDCTIICSSVFSFLRNPWFHWVKLNASHACGATQDGRVMVEKSDRMWSTGEGNGKPLQYSCLENPMNSMKRQNDRIPKEELPRSLGARYATGDQWRKTPERMKGWSKSKNNTQLWMWLVIEASSDAVKSNIA